MQVLGVELECRWFGAGDASKPTIVLLHEGLGSISMWGGFPEQLAKATGCPVFAYSRQSYGASDPLAAPRNPDYMHIEGEKVLPALLEAAGIRKPILFGHSDGGSIALLFAMHRPDDVCALILEAPHVFVEDLTIESIVASKAAYPDGRLKSRLARHHQDPDAAFWGWNDIWLDPRFRAWNIEDRLAKATCPKLLIQSENDPYGTKAQLDAIAAASPPTEIVLLSKCGHAPHRDQREAVLAHTRAFVDGIRRGDNSPIRQVS